MMSLIDYLAPLHPNGHRVARMAMDAGFDMSDLVSVTLSSPGRPRSDFPVLSFDDRNGGCRTITPQEYVRAPFSS